VKDMREGGAPIFKKRQIQSGSLRYIVAAFAGIAYVLGFGLGKPKRAIVQPR
jgi:hypothetical protein